ncbi:MAG: response regulator transcription factor [Streptosporangiaceae bacterium]|nr:response regulator transcription factor [Streptosporangiaceae bacterium]
MRADDKTPPTEPLTEREQKVLYLLRGTLSLREIGRELDLSVNTVKTYTRGIYRKLGVASRRDAVRRAPMLASYADAPSTAATELS